MALPGVNKDQRAVDALSAPIPGQSLTQDPENKQPWETPPEITDIKEAREFLFERLINPEMLPSILMLVESGMPVSKLASLVVKQGFQKGMWTPDLVLLLVEPVALMIIAIAKEFDYDPVIVDANIAKTAEEQLDFIRSYQSKIPKDAEPVLEETPELAGLMSPSKGGI